MRAFAGVSNRLRTGMDDVTIVAVDLAAKYSAAVLMDEHCNVLAQVDSWGKTDDQFIACITMPWILPEPPAALVVEDLPHRLPFAALVKHVCRLQGRIVETMSLLGDFEKDVLFAPPAEWRRSYPELRKWSAAAQLVVPTAAAFGYNPPDLTERAAVVKGGRAIARKVQTDYCAAYLIGRWAMHHYHRFDNYEAPGTLRYGQIPHKKNKPHAKASSDAQGTS